MTNLSPHFTLEEFTRSDTGERYGADNTPNPAIIKNLRGTATCMEDIRSLLSNVPIYISSGYRSLDVNRLVGGAVNSAHMQGYAADFAAPQFGDPLAICKYIHATIFNFPIDQLIWEFSWVHLSFAPNPRHQILVRQKGGPVAEVKSFPYTKTPIA